jgi:ubiquinol-cytochrome c reductase cytochrome c1 subunit
MRARFVLAGLCAAALMAPAAWAQEAPEPPHQEWSFSGPFGGFDLASLQRGFQIYQEVCSNCHSMKQLSYRNLSGIGLNEEQIRAIAASVQVPAGFNDQGEPITAPGTPASHFRSPFPNEAAARAANNGAYPPDLSVIVKAREDGPDYVYAILTGYAEAPPDVKMQPGMNYNKYFPGHQIAMPQPLQEGQITYADGTKNTLEQEAHDVVSFLTWAANPEMVERKRMGVRWVLFLTGMTVLTYFVKRKVWAEAH